MWARARACVCSEYSTTLPKDAGGLQNACGSRRRGRERGAVCRQGCCGVSDHTGQVLTRLGLQQLLIHREHAAEQVLPAVADLTGAVGPTPRQLHTLIGMKGLLDLQGTGQHTTTHTAMWYQYFPNHRGTACRKHDQPPVWPQHLADTRPLQGTRMLYSRG